MTISATDQAAVGEWIRGAAHPLRTADPLAPLDDLRPLLAMVGERTAVAGFGAGTRGARELLALQVRVARLLLAEADFRVLALDQDAGLGAALDAYVRTGAGDVAALLQAAEPFSRTGETLALVRWLRALRQTRPRAAPGVVGVSPRETGASAYDAVTDYVRRAAPGRLAELASHYAELRPPGDVSDHTRRYQALTDRRPWRERARAAHDLVAAVPGHDGHAWARYQARLIVQYHALHDHGHDPLDPHNMAHYEWYFAENVLWWHRHTGHRVLFWSSSSHTARAPGRVVSFPPNPPGASPNAGSHLHADLGDRYLSIGLTFGTGELAPYTGAPPHRVPAPVPPLVEAVLDGAGAGDFLLDLRQRAPRRVAEWLAQPVTSRLVGPRHDPRRDPAHHMAGGSLAEWFDVLVHRRRVTPARPLDPAGPAPAG
ncbi:erythromycin esterase family protein [Streptomyces sp. 71268]|uniref:erythromycin esterase family protein n=1 Tax=Streptomyces sp. 71268 TaxID=3002640 RepID=UPI0023FA46C8|nr:erythromycin esterase family protein [Streptomyces sp. 71268]WEV25364.1 erythromycin esterase family protein [Streptomyces sp. 71268]